MARTLRDLVKDLPRSKNGFPAALGFCKKHDVPKAVIAKLQELAFDGYGECGPFELVAFGKIPKANSGISARALKQGFLIIGTCPNGDPLAVELATAKMVYVSHDILWEWDPEAEDFDPKCIARTNLAIDDFWWRANNEKDFPVDYYAATR